MDRPAKMAEDLDIKVLRSRIISMFFSTGVVVKAVSDAGIPISGDDAVAVSFNSAEDVEKGKPAAPALVSVPWGRDLASARTLLSDDMKFTVAEVRNSLEKAANARASVIKKTTAAGVDKLYRFFSIKAGSVLPESVAYVFDDTSFRKSMYSNFSEDVPSALTADDDSGLMQDSVLKCELKKFAVWISSGKLDDVDIIGDPFKVDFPIVSVLARSYHAGRAAVTDVDCAFSLTRRILSELRTRMHPDLTEAFGLLGHHHRREKNATQRRQKRSVRDRIRLAELMVEGKSRTDARAQLATEGAACAAPVFDSDDDSDDDAPVICALAELGLQPNADGELSVAAAAELVVQVEEGGVVASEGDDEHRARAITVLAGIAA